MRYNPDTHEYYREVDFFTVLSLELQTDHNADGQICAADSSALALDWNREWLVPATTNRWFPVKIFKDVAMPGVYTVTVTGSTNIIVRYGDTCVRGGQSEEVDFPLAQSQETLEVQAAAPGAATLTVTFTGTGTATNYNCSTCVNIKTWDVAVSISDPDSSEWAELEEKRVVLSDENLRIKIVVTPKVNSLLDVFNLFGNILSIKTSGTAPEGQMLSLTTQNTEFIQRLDRSELRITQTRNELKILGILPDPESDQVEEKAWLDTGSIDPSADSNLSDGVAFDSLVAEPRGRCTSDGDLDATTENSRIHLSFFQAAGREIIRVQFASVVTPKRQIMNQADYFYYSGHGSHATGGLTVGSPSVLDEYWNQDLDCAIIAGCAVLDINDYNDNYTGVDHTASPGKVWETLGPQLFLGYNWYAPTDIQGATAIISSWLTHRDVLGNADAWRMANENSAGWNACVIVKDVSYSYYRKISIGGFTLGYEWVTVPKANW